MAFNRDNFARMSGHANSNVPVMWGYTTTDLGTVVDTASYFDDVAGEVQVGDLIYAAVATSGTAAYMLYAVVSNDGTTVDVSDGTALSVTDTR